MIRNRFIRIPILLVLALAPTNILSRAAKRRHVSPTLQVLKGEARSDPDQIREMHMSLSYDGDYDESEDPDDTISGPNIETELQFITYCQDWLLPKTNKDIISQDDFADFLVEACDVLHDRDLPDFRCPTPAFTDLAIRVQFLFARYSCDGASGSKDGASGSKDISQCLKSYLASGEEFGLVVTKKTRKDVESTVFEICCGLLSFLTLAELEYSETECPATTPIEIPPTFAPTKSPSISSPPATDPITPATSTPLTEPPTSTVDAASLDPSSSPLLTSIPTISPTVDDTTILPTVVPLVTSPPSPTLDPTNATAPTTDPGTTTAVPSKSNDDPSNLEDEPSRPDRPVVVANRNGGGGLSAGTIAGFTLGAGGLCILGMASWRRLLENSDEDEDTD